MGPGARGRARRAHDARAVAGEIPTRQAAGGPHGALQGAALLPALHEHAPALARPDVADTALLRRSRRPRSEALFEQGQLLAHRLAHEDLRVGGRVALRPLPVAHRLLCHLEGLDERKGLAQGFVIERPAEPGVVTALIAAEG